MKSKVVDIFDKLFALKTSLSTTKKNLLLELDTLQGMDSRV